MSAKTIVQSPGDCLIANTGEVVGYSETRIRNSPDGEYYSCFVAGKKDGGTICLFVPSQML